MGYLKYVWLVFIRFIRRVFNKLPTILSYAFLAFSVITCVIILVPNCFDRVPVLSYYISEHELPIAYELCGNVTVFDANNNIVNKNVEVFVGGYSTALTSSEFSLKFSSPNVDEFFVVIRYEVDGSIREYMECLTIEDRSHVINEEFYIHAGDL